MSEPVAMKFRVDRDESGNPPIGEEILWCLPHEGGTYVVDNIPFYVYDVSIGDEVRGRLEDGHLWFDSMVRPSRNTTVRVFARKEAAEPLIVPRMRSFGGLTEKMEGGKLVAVSFPPEADLASALAFLDEESATASLAFEESAVRYR